MEFGTYIFESREMDLGDASEAYNNYPQVKIHLDNKLAEYQEAVIALSNENLISITIKQEQWVDTLAKEAEKMHEKHKILTAILSSKINGMLDENARLEKDLSCHAALIKADDIIFCISLHSEAVQLMDNGEILTALEKAYHARENFIRLLTEAKTIWIEHHLKNADNMNIGKMKEENK